ncbi:hypothetical protein C5613_24550 [Rhodococcus opacus]|uniref:Carboxymuconolactone decarboxylase-like domain-containing protein n=1 Tax=Rhodococcus opacus TaxID=37919 RepID=A0A2S8J4V3_RHOOP|nr:hypothetical protein C5613_24550 [Rhodococcus opacus]
MCRRQRTHPGRRRCGVRYAPQSPSGSRPIASKQPRRGTPADGPRVWTVRHATVAGRRGGDPAHGSRPTVIESDDPPDPAPPPIGKELTLADLYAVADAHLREVDDGEPLDPLTRTFIELAVRSSVATLDIEGAKRHMQTALDLGATADQVHEVLMLVSGLGVHTLFETTGHLYALASERQQVPADSVLDTDRHRLWERFVENDPYRQRLEDEIPGFLHALIRISPEAFAAFCEYCAVPWQTKNLRAVTKELIALAVDATPHHRYLPGLKLHLRNAIELGAGRNGIREALQIASHAPPHRGVR